MPKKDWSTWFTASLIPSLPEHSFTIIHETLQILLKNMALKAKNYGDGRERITSAWLPTKRFAMASAIFKPNIIFKILCIGIGKISNLMYFSMVYLVWYKKKIKKIKIIKSLNKNYFKYISPNRAINSRWW